MISNNQQDKPSGRRWRERAACRGSDPELFYPAADSGPARKAQVAAAKAVCARCPVRAECLDEALKRIPYGICGGLTEQERHRLRTTGQPQHAQHSAGQRGGGWRRDGLTAEAREALFHGPDGLRGRQRARVGRALLAAGRSTRQVAWACGVTERTVARWATHIRTTDDAAGDGVGRAGYRAGLLDAGEGSTAATGLPSGSPEHTTPQAGIRAPEGLRA